MCGKVFRDGERAVARGRDSARSAVVSGMRCPAVCFGHGGSRTTVPPATSSASGWPIETGLVRPDHARTLNPAAGYRAALVEHLSNATLVVDHFHAIKLANAAIDDIRRRRPATNTLGHRGRKGDPLHRARRACSSPAPTGCPTNASGGCSTCSPPATPTAKSAPAIMAKELLREVYGAHDLAHARPTAGRLLPDTGPTPTLPELARLSPNDQTAGATRSSPPTTPGQASNERVENVHRLAEKIRRNAHGFANHQNYRRRLLGRRRHQVGYRPNSQNPRPSTTPRAAPAEERLPLSRRFVFGIADVNAECFQQNSLVQAPTDERLTSNRPLKVRANTEQNPLDLRIETYRSTISIPFTPWSSVYRVTAHR